MAESLRETVHAPRQHLVRSTAMSFGMTIISNLMMLVGQIIIIRFLTREDFAAFSLALSVVVMFAVIADLGLGPMFVREFTIKSHHATNRELLGNDLGSAIMLRALLTGFVSIGLVGGLIWLGYSYDFVILVSIFLVNLVISSRFAVLRNVADSFLRILGKYPVVTGLSMLDALAFASLALCFKEGLDVRSAVLVYTLASIPGFVLIVWIVLYEVTKLKIKLNWRPEWVLSMLKRGLPLVVATVFLTMSNELDKLLLTLLSSEVELARYRAVYSFLGAFLFIWSVINAVFTPEIIRAFDSDDRSRMMQVFLLATRLTLFLTVLVGLSLALFADDLVALVLGPQYIDTGEVLRLAGCVLPLVSIGALLVEGLIAMGRFWGAAFYMGSLMLVILLADVLLLPQWGAEGAMTARAIGAVAALTGVFAWYAKILKIAVLEMAVLTCKAIVGGVCCFYLGAILSSFMPTIVAASIALAAAVTMLILSRVLLLQEIGLVGRWTRSLVQPR